MNNLWINETWINATEKNICCGDSDPYETFTDNTRILFKSLQKEYGKCISKMYIDKKDGPTIQAGWVFEKLQKYDDCNEKYLAQTWVTVYKSEPIKSVSYECEYAFN